MFKPIEILTETPNRTIGEYHKLVLCMDLFCDLLVGVFFFCVRPSVNANVTIPRMTSAPRGLLRCIHGLHVLNVN